MKKIHIMLLLLLLMITGSCASLYVTNKQLMDIEQGMNRQDVKKIVGMDTFESATPLATTTVITTAKN